MPPEGAASTVRVTYASELLEHVATPDGRVRFAGEHTSSWPGWIQGALQSGLRAADEVNAAAA